ncbi:bridge-like lipid transfer protein family member 1 [Haliotis cracherodii]|uniref:bridge-like lipid transfer protein family member 1 n=1 Tax=Haliotis cracherodii TaxID=6455 RepID=UPI0039EB4227
MTAIMDHIKNSNSSIIQMIEDELPKSTVYYLLIAIVMAQAWTVYLSYYHSRVLGLIITAFLNKFIKYGHIRLGSFSFSVLSGKIMFREVHLITEDFSFRVQFGWIIFRWWRPYIYKELSEDFSHSDTRMSLFLDGVEFHVYNRSSNYAKMEKLFGLSPDAGSEQVSTAPGAGSGIKVPENADGLHWRDLIPVTKITINSGRVIFGNYLVPYTLIGSFEEGHLIYTTKPASTPFDKFMHVLKCKVDNMKVMLVPSPKFTGPTDDEPPRFMGEGFVILQSRDVDIYFYMDEPGVVPHEPELMEMADGEVVVRRTYPCMGVDIKCGRNTDFNYGPWVDRQREHLWKFFYPPDYQPQVPSVESEPGEKRNYKTFEVKLIIISAATFDILFTKNSETQAVHMNTGQGSYIEAIIPWMIEEKGYTTKVKGQLMLLDMTTSMTFRSLVECETFEFEVSGTYPIVWNEHQDWRLDFTACKAIVYLIFEHKNFFRDLSDDWSTKSRPDIYSFIPYTWTVNLTVKQFELLTLANEYNWIDTSSQHPENAHIAFCGENMDLSLQLPFVDFLPVTLPIQLVIKGETVDCRLYLPESNTSRHVVIALAENMKIFDRDGNPTDKPFAHGKQKPWRKVTTKSTGWVDCWSTSHVLLSIRYTYHPMPILGTPVSSKMGLDDLPTPDREESLLMPLRPLCKPECSNSRVTPETFDAAEWDPDVFSVELEVAPSVLCLYGSLFRYLINVKENYLGEDQKVADFKADDSSPESEDRDSSFVNITASNTEKNTSFDPRAYRPFAVTVSVILQDIQAHLVRNCGADDITSPCARVERLCFELDKSYLETKLQLLLSPSVLIARDNLVRDADQDHLKEGHLALSGLQVRGHAMFSHVGLPLDCETLEYAWLVEAVIGEVTGRLTAPQVQNVAEFLQTFVLLIDDPENKLKRPTPWGQCQHMLPQPTCRMLPSCPFPCPSSDDIKYRLVRASVDSVNLFIVESGAALNLWVSSVRISTCNLHGNNTRSGITCVVDQVTLKQHISCAPLRLEPGHPEMWLDAGGFSFGPLNVEAAMALPNSELHYIQDHFLHMHDKKTRRLWFLWPIPTTHAGQNANIAGKCGCLGGCVFFGKNKNGTNFFKSRRHREHSNVAIPQVFPEGVDPGFAQSLLHKDKLVFDVGHSLKSMTPKMSPTEFSFTRGYMSDVASPDTPGVISSTLMDSLLMGGTTDHGELDSSRDNTLTSDITSVRSNIRGSWMDGRNMDAYADPKVKDSSSVSIHFVEDRHSIESATLRRQTSITASTCSSSPSSPSVPRQGPTLSGGSVDSTLIHSTTSKSSIPSPVPIHRIAGSATAMDKLMSTVSLESDRYYSAEEDVLSLSEADSQQQYHSLLSEITDSPNSPCFDIPGFSFGHDKTIDATVLEQKGYHPNMNDLDYASSASSSTSTLSYTSAPTDHESETMSGEAPEEFSLIDLHSQMNQPITKSPLLLSRYSSHLSHYNCHDWVAPPPIHSAGKSIHSLQSEHSLSSASQSVYGSAALWIPHFSKVRQGFSTSVMKEKSELKLPSPPGPRRSEAFDWSRIDEQNHEEEDNDDKKHLENTSKTTAVIKVAGTFDILVTPLLLESLQRYIEAVTPCLASMHPSALIDRLHSHCLDQLKQQNNLKKGQTGNPDDQDQPADFHPNLSQKSSTDRRTSDVVKTSSLQAFFSLPKINLCVMQASLVEEVISFAVLDNINDLTAVSLMAVCVDGIKCQLLSNTHHCKKLTGDPGPRRTSTTPVQQRTRHDSSDTEQSIEHTREENVGTLKLNRIHCQLRRLLKHSNFSDNVVLTAIPEHRSNVLFTFDQDGSSSVSHIPVSPRKRLSRQASRDSRDGGFDATIGVIMFECGLEEVSVTAVRRLGYKDTMDMHLQQKMDNIEKALQELQECTREEIEQLTESGTSPTDHEPMSSPSSHHSSESMSSWDSRLSLASNVSGLPPPTPEPLQGDASNGRLRLKTIWLSFAAPPPISIKKKVDFTRLDWNLLSTATPAINAWLNPCDRAMLSVKHLVSELTKRNSSVMACIMTQALEEQGIHVCNKSKFGKMTSLSKTLQDEPSSQLLTVLRKYLHIHGCGSIERAVLSETAPQLITMQKGILALTRQWKNVLYMPYMSDIHFKSKKSVRPYNVTFSIPKPESSENLCTDDGEGTIEQFDVVDEKTSLLQAEGGLVMKSTSNPSLISRGGPSSSAAGRVDHGHDGVSTVSTSSFQPKKFLATVRSRGRGAFPNPVLSCMDSPERKVEQTQTAATLSPPTAMPRNDSNFSFMSAADSISSIDQAIASTPPHTPLRTSGQKQLHLKNRYSKITDMYQWMTAQQEDFKDPLDDGTNYGRTHENMSTGFGSAWSQDDSRTDVNEEYLTMATSIMQLADAQLLFRPLLQSLGLHVEGVRPSAMMKKFGGHLLLQANLDILKIQIAESEASYSKGSHKGKGKSKKYRLNMNAGNSAFSCEGFGVNISMKDVVDFGQKDAGVGGRSKRFPWKFAMHKLEAKPTTLQVNFLIKCQAITQHVDMALLRLVHQVVTMVDNIKETQVELKQRRSGFEWVKTHRKQESKDSTSSADTQQSDLSKVDQPSAETQISTPDQSLCSDTLIQESEKHVAKTPKSVSSFRLALDSKRPDKLPLTSSSKKSQLRFAKEPKRRSDITVTPSQHSEVLTPPQSLNLSDSVTMDLVDTSSPALAEKTIVDEIKESTPQCWRHLYHLLELYSTMPEPKTVLRKPGMQKLPIIEEEEPESEMKRDNSKLGSGSLKRDSSKMGSGITLQDEEGKIPDMGNEEQDIGVKGPSLAQTSFIRTRFKQSIYIGESIPLVVYGIAKIEKVQVLAVLSGLKLEAELRRVHASGTYKERVKGFLHRKSSDSSFTAHVGHTMIVLLEGVPPSMQTVVTVNIRKSQALHTTVMRRAKEHNSALASIGHIDIDIPQHPVVLHGMMTRSSRQLTSTLQEFGWPLSRTASKPSQPDVVDGEVKEEVKKEQTEQSENKAPGKPRRTGQPPPPSVSKPVTLHIHFKTVFQGITTAASILPSLKAQHKTGSITVAGMTGKKARFTVVLPKHTLSFRSKVVTTETSIPSSASIELPPIHVYADYRQHKAGAPVSETLTEGLILKAGSYMNAVAEVGMLEHSLTTDLLNHLVFVQKVFMKEVNEVVQKVSGSDQPMRLWSEEEKSTQAGDPEPLLYSFSFRFKGIQITATTPTSNAVRLETGEIELEVSNRVHMAARESQPDLDYEDNQKVFIRAQIYLNVALGQLLKNQVFEEAEPEFQTMAFFKTKIGIRNALQDEMIPGVSTNQEALIINLSRPIVLAQPLAFDKAVLVWLNYKNAYEYWTEQRMSLNKEVQTATQEVINKLPQFAQAAAAPSLSTLFLQLTVDDMGICVPIDTLSYQVPPGPGLGRMAESDPGAALVLTIESSQISACSSGSLVSKGRFKGFSFRFADDFETSWDDWKPNGKEEPNMNICCVPEGTYEVCSRTINKQASDPRSNAKWILNVQWQMQGIDVHLDTNIGKRLTALGHNLTALAGEAEAGFGTGFGMQEDETDGLDNEATDTEIDDPLRRPSLVSDILPEELLSQDLDPKERARQIEREMNEQAKVVQDLKQLGATLSIIEAERRKLEELQAILFHDFRRDVFNKLKKQSERASAIRDKLGLNPKPAHSRSKSYGGHHGKRKDHQGECSRVTSYTMDPRRQARTHSIDLAAISPSGHVARVQFGATRSNTYTPPGTPDAMTSSFDETDLPLLRESVSLQDLTSDSDLPSSTDSDTPDSQINLDTVFRRRPSRMKRKLKTSSNPSIGSGIASKTSAAEPNIDFELDVKVFIDSGKCVLYPKEARDEEVKRQQKRERNLSGEQTASPVMRRKLKRQESSSTLLQAKKTIVPPQVTVETTVFYLPSVDVKVHYYSKTTLAELVHSTGSISDGERMFSSSVDRPDLTAQSSTDVFTTQSDGNWDSVDNCSNVSILSRRGAVKKANLYAWLSLQKLPEEMIISPCLLDFLEQALEPLPFSAPLHKKDLMGSVLNMDLDASQASLGSPVSMASFPVDVVVYIKVEPSVIRFNCRPISRVECLLQVPSLELVFSTKKSDLDGSIAEGTPPMKAKIPKRTHEWLPSNSTSSRSRLGSTLSEGSSSTHSGGLSVTGCLSDFSLYVFHPYGGGQRRLGSIQEHAGGGVLEMSRKDSLSLNVEFIKVNISRSRKMELRGASENSLSGNKEAQMKSNVVRFSAICDIGTASFKYDMRRLSEILSLPKAWYRRNLARRLFLGDESIVHTGADAEVDATLSSNRPTLSTQASLSFPSLTVVEENEPFRLTHHRRVSSGDKVKIQISSDLKNEIYQKSSRRGSSVPQSPTEGGGSNVTPKLGAPGARKSRAYSSPDTGRHRSSSAPPAPTSRSSKWETLVLFAVNLSRLDVDVNMSNVMGNTLWSTRELKSHGRLSIDSSGHKHLKITGGLGGSSFESRGGVVGGAIDLLGLQTFFHVTEDPELGKDPDHRAGLTLEAIEGRVDYMGSSVLMTRLSLLDLLLRDEWHVESDTQSDTPLATKRSAYLFVNGDLHWDQFHLMISRSTTPDLIKLVAKLDEFFTQQLTSSKRVLSAFGPIPPRNRTTSQRKLSEDSEFLSELRHHRHWQGALEQLVGCNFRMLPQILPSEGMILGGTVTLQGENLSLASFHGINFRSKSWAIFNIREPYIYFSTEAQKTPDRGTHVVQDLTFIIGHKLTKGGTSSQPPPNSSAPHMATICKVSRGHYVPQQFTSVQEWFNYAFFSSDMKEIDSFPSVRREHCESPTEHRKSRKPQAYNHESEMIFAFPSLYMNLKTFHYQGEHEPQNDDPRPVVESSFVTEFYDHIFVAMDAEVILFLHDLVSSYIKEKDKGARSSYGQASKAAKATDPDKKKLTDPTEALKQDYRDFHCKTWQLEPTVRLLHWASKQIDPVGVDFVLQKLGFSHARVTIPKWMQRGVMDPLDKILSMLVNSLVVALKDQQDRDVVDDVD